MVKIGISSWSCPWAIGVPGYPAPEHPLDAIGLLKLAYEVGAEVLQIADNLPLHALEATELAALAERAKGFGIALEVGTRGLDPENLLRYLDISQIMGARLVRTLPHDGGDRPDLTGALRRLNAVKGRFEAAGVRLAIENHDFYPCAWLRELVENACSPAVGVCLDAVNNLGQGESFRETLACLGPYTVNFHCKDYTIARKLTMLGFDVSGAPAGAGMLDLDAALRTLPDGISWVIESWLPWQGDILHTVETERLWLETGIENLRVFRHKQFNW